MAITLEEVVTAARDRHPAFHRSRVPNAVLARFLSDHQNEIIGKGLRRDPHYLVQSATVALSFDSSSAIGTAGAGTSGGVPGSIASDGSFSTVETTAGSLVDPKLTTADGAAVAVAERVVSSAATTSVTSTGAARTVNADTGKVVTITQGRGFGQSRAILSNTADTWVVSTGSDGLIWETTPDSTSMLTVVEPAYESDLIQGVITDLPAITNRTGYLVKLSAVGVPYIDWSAPVVASVDAGVPLPPFIAIVGGICRYANNATGPLYLTSQAERHDPAGWPAVFVSGQSLLLCGESADWSGVVSLEIQYAPVAPTFTALADFFLVPDAAKGTMVASAAAFMAERVAGLEGISINPDALLARAMEAERAYLGTISATRRGQVSRIRDVF